jgi:hypothetical protein
VIELTLFEKVGGILSKKISLDASGQVHNDSSQCAMGTGRAERVTIDGVGGLGALIERMRSNQAIAPGALRGDLAGQVHIVTAEAFAKIADPPATTVTRTKKNFTYRPGEPAIVLFDLDVKGMTDDVKRRVAAHGGDYWKMLCAVFPGLAGAEHLVRASTSAGLSRSDTKQAFPSSGGMHCYVVVRDGSDAERFLRCAHDRAWLAGYGWMMISVAGRFLPRSIVDRLVAQPERLMFEGPPVVEPPLVQDAAARCPIVVVGELVDSLKLCPPLNVVEKAQLEKLQADAKVHLEPERRRAEAAYVDDRAPDLARRRGISLDAARRVIEKRCGGTLLPDDELHFDDDSVLKVGVVLDHSDMYDGDTLADPLEGVQYGRGKAYVHLGADGDWVYSFAHGGMFYHLRYDARAVRERLAATPEADLVDRLVSLLLRADVDPVEEDDLVHEVCQRARRRIKPVTDKIKAARAERARRRGEDRRERERARRADPRPQVDRPPTDAPLIPAMEAVNAVVAAAPPRARMLRDPDGDGARPHRLAIPPVQPYDDEEEDADDQAARH